MPMQAMPALDPVVDEERLRLCTQVAMAHNLPLNYADQIRGNNRDEMEEDIWRVFLQAQQAEREAAAAAVASVPIFTAEQMANPQFVRDNEAAIRAAQAERQRLGVDFPFVCPFTAEQLNDPRFVREHQSEIQDAYRRGLLPWRTTWQR